MRLLQKTLEVNTQSMNVLRFVLFKHICRASGEDLGAIMVREGMAWAFVRYSRDYVDQEARAKSARVGVHAHDCAPAWEWRARQRQ